MTCNAKIAHLTSVHQRFDTRIFVKECKSLANDGFTTYLVVADGKGSNQDLAISIYDVNISLSRLNRLLRTTSAIFQQAKELDVDIYHFHDPELIPVGLLLKQLGKTVIYDVHEDLPRQLLSKHYIPYALRKTISFCVEKIENFACEKFDAIVTATPAIRDRFLKLNTTVIDINNYPIVEEFQAQEVNSLKGNRKENIICYVGGISIIRGIEQMVDAIGYTDAKLLLAGNFTNTSAEKISSIKELVGWKKVEEMGYLDRLGVAQTMACSQAGLVLLHPVINYLDSLPVKMFEYMSAGLPIIASNFPLWREIIEGNQCGLCVDPLDTKAIAQAINYILEHPDEAEKMGKNGKKAISEKYNWEIEKSKLLQLYHQLSNSH